MPVKQPTAEEVKLAFTSAIPADRKFDPDAYDKYLRSLTAKDWQSAGSGVEVLDVVGVRLVRIYWNFSVDVMDGAANSALTQSVSALKQTLDSLVTGSAASFGEIKFEETALGKNFTVRCRAHGIIG